MNGREGQEKSRPTEDKMKQKKFNIIDIIAVALIVAVVTFVGYKVVVQSGSSAGVSVGTVDVTFVGKAEGVDAVLAENIQQYIPSQLMASGELYDGYVMAAQAEPYMVLSGDGQWVEDPERVNLYLTVEATIADQGVMTTEVATQEVRIGRKVNIIKTEYIEFTECIIVDVTWE
ncbi:DUF4330 domain-containing protein [Bengtsoniella intestinalis]|uniref:DUF4330 domain-containing protein n=1 Tax=Bengtsoniella intestinalis TaxID=3073143 RepID=UPI00391F2870